jgi:hypothetical protein
MINNEMNKDERFLKAFKLNLLGLSIAFLGLGFEISSILFSVFNDELPSAIIGIMLMVFGVGTYLIGVAKR